MKEIIKYFCEMLEDYAKDCKNNSIEIAGAILEPIINSPEFIALKALPSSPMMAAFRSHYHEDIKDKLRRRSELNPETGCIEWRGAITGGYGLLSLRNNGKRTTRSAHRLSYEAHIGEIPKGICICHKCDNRKCINPDHLFLGTHLDNAKDREKKGRGNHRVGEECTAKLTEEQIILIRQLSIGGVSQKEIALKFGMNASTISYIVNQKTWKHVK